MRLESHGCVATTRAVFSLMTGQLCQKQLWRNLASVNLKKSPTKILWVIVFNLGGCLASCLKVMKRAASCKQTNRQNYNVRKSCSILTYILKFGRCVEKHATYQKMAASMESLPACCCKNESEIGFFTVTS